MGKYLKKAQSKGLIRKVRATKGLLADGYSRGIFFDTETQDSRRLIKLSNSLWGTKGLLRTWPYPTAWGHGCLPGAVILSLATLRLLEESISKKSLREYLSPLVPQSSFNSGLKFLFEKHLVFGEGDRLIIAPDWESKLERWLDTHPACNERQEAGDKRRAVEIENNRIRVQKGKLTEGEKAQLLALPCVVKGCPNKRHQLEHFPPRHFLKQLDEITNRHFVWSICKAHNRVMADFIKSLDNTIPIQPVLLVMRRGADPMRIYSAAVNREIQKFYEAAPKQKGEHASEEDIEAAQQAITSAIGLWKAIDKLPEKLKSVKSPQKHSSREIIGQQSYFPSHSKLPYQKN
jgi:hypothetical protein